MCILHTIYSRFKDAVLVRFLSSVGLGGKGTKINAFKGAKIVYYVY